jgi:hypothetical protein
MKLYVLVGAAVSALLLPRAALCQTESYPSQANDTRTQSANPHAVVNNSLPTDSGSGMNNPSQHGRANAVFVEHEITKARAKGKDVTGAEGQYKMGMAALNRGLNKEAAQHFDTALRAVGVEPKAQGYNPGETTHGHAAVPGSATH